MKSEKTIVRTLHSLCYAIKNITTKGKICEMLDCSMLELSEIEQYLENVPFYMAKHKELKIKKTAIQLIEDILYTNSFTQIDIFKIVKTVLAQETKDELSDVEHKLAIDMSFKRETEISSWCKYMSKIEGFTKLLDDINIYTEDIFMGHKAELGHKALCFDFEVFIQKVIRYKQEESK